LEMNKCPSFCVKKKGELYLIALIFVKKLKEACDVQKNIINN
jgi:hypothetical protein